MDDPVVVGGAEALGDLGRVIDGLAHRQWPLGDASPQRLALQQLGHRVRDAVRSPEVEYGEDVRVGGRGDGLGFPLEARECRGVLATGVRGGP